MCRILCLKSRALNLPALVQHWENSTATCKVFPSCADLAASLSSQSYTTPECMGTHNLPDGKHPDTIINNFKALLGNTQDVMDRTVIFIRTRESIKHKSRNKPYILEEQLHTMELCIYHSIKIQVEGLKGEWILQVCRCIGSQSWRGGDRRKDWVWLK
jgi:hypothetical protein